MTATAGAGARWIRPATARPAGGGSPCWSRRCAPRPAAAITAGSAPTPPISA